MTAAWIAKELGNCSTVHVNYLISDILYEKQFGKENPLPKLEFLESGCDFEKMKTISPEFTKEYFPEGITVVEDLSDPQTKTDKEK